MKISSICPLTCGRTETVESGSTFPHGGDIDGHILANYLGDFDGHRPGIPALAFFALLAAVGAGIRAAARHRQQRQHQTDQAHSG